jgi:hypothetical protein
MINVVPATQEHVERTFGVLKRSAEMISFVRDDGELVGCAGIFPETSRLVLFSDMKDDVRRFPRALVRGYRKLLEMADRRRMPLHALPDPSIEASERFLTHMGFRKLTENCWERLPEGSA